MPTESYALLLFVEHVDQDKGLSTHKAWKNFIIIQVHNYIEGVFQHDIRNALMPSRDF